MDSGIKCCGRVWRYFSETCRISVCLSVCLPTKTEINFHASVLKVFFWRYFEYLVSFWLVLIKVLLPCGLWIFSNGARQLPKILCALKYWHMGLLTQLLLFVWRQNSELQNADPRCVCTILQLNFLLVPQTKFFGSFLFDWSTVMFMVGKLSNCRTASWL